MTVINLCTVIKAEDEIWISVSLSKIVQVGDPVRYSHTPLCVCVCVCVRVVCVCVLYDNFIIIHLGTLNFKYVAAYQTAQKSSTYGLFRSGPRLTQPLKFSPLAAIQLPGHINCFVA